MKIRVRKLLSKKNRKGISLIEVLVSLTLTVLLVTALTSMLSPITLGYARAEDSSILASVGTLLMEDVVSRAMGCRDIFVLIDNSNITSAKLGGRIQIRINNNGYLEAHGKSYTSVLLPSENSYNGCKVTDFTITCSRSPVMTDPKTGLGKVRVMNFTIKLKRNDTEYEVSRTATIMNLEYYEKDYDIDDPSASTTYSSEIYVYYKNSHEFSKTDAPASVSSNTKYKSFAYMPQGVLV